MQLHFAARQQLQLVADMKATFRVRMVRSRTAMGEWSARRKPTSLRAIARHDHVPFENNGALVACYSQVGISMLDDTECMRS